MDLLFNESKIYNKYENDKDNNNNINRQNRYNRNLNKNLENSNRRFSPLMDDTEIRENLENLSQKNSKK